jgi:Protein of unknown function (DUF2652)
MENAGLIFIPDISGFTKFVNETEIEHSRHIIEELLETIINSNELDLNVSEIEGDAILFYKFGDPPRVQQLVQQVERMFCEFHKQILNYEHRRMCQCLACKNAVDLSLKVVIHYGEFSSYKVKEFSKLLGKDIIVAHQLLKNDIDRHEYMLVTDRIPAKEELRDLPSWVSWNTGKKLTEVGEVPYNYSLLTPLKKAISPDPLPELEPAEKIKSVTSSREYNIDIIDLLAIIGKFSQRAAWEDGVREVDQVTDKIPQLGTRHRCVLDKKSVIVQYSTFSYEPGKIVLSETEERKRGITYYTFEKVAGGKTRLILDYYIPKNPLSQILFNLTRKQKISSGFQKSLTNLEKHIQNLGDRARWKS